ncbi:MAG: hypothetical protein WCY62_09305 [Clostridia bacterium]
MNLLLSELRKTFVSKTTIIFLILIVVINGITLYVNENISFGYEMDLRVVREIDEKLMLMEEDQAKDYLNEHIIAMEYALLIVGRESEGLERLVNKYPDYNVREIAVKYDQGIYDEYSGKPYFYKLLLLQKMEEINTAYSYDEYRKGISKAAISMQTSPLFADSLFAKRNAIKTADAFEHLSVSDIRFNSSEGMITATKNGITTIYLLVAVLFICFHVYIRDKDNNTLSLLRTMRKGRKHLMFSKIISATALGLITAFLLTISSYITGYILYGFGDIHMPIQSVYGFQSCVFELSVLDYLIVYAFILIIAVIFLTTLMMLVFVLIKDSIAGIITAVLAFAVSIVLYNTISSVSSFNAFKYLNLYFLLDAGKIIGNYFNINVAGYPLSIFPVFLITVIACSVISSLISIRIFDKQRDIQGLYLKGKQKKNNTNKIYTSNFGFEAYKCLIINPVVPILVIFLLFQVFTVKAYPSEQRLGTKDYIYMYYMKILEGPVTNEKTLILQELLNEVQKEIIQDANSVNKDKMTVILDLIAKDSSLNLMKDSIENIDLKDSISFVYEKGYDEFFKDNYLSRKAALYTLLLVILCAANVFAMEKSRNTFDIITSTLYGRKRTFIYKSIISCLSALFIMASVYGPLIMKIAKESGFACLNAPIACIDGMENYPISVSISDYFILLFILKFIGLIILVSIINFISHITGERIMTIAITLPFMVIPAFLTFMGADSFSDILFNVYLYGNSLMTLEQSCVVQASVLAFIALLLSYMLYRKYRFR